MSDYILAVLSAMIAGALAHAASGPSDFGLIYAALSGLCAISALGALYRAHNQ